MTNYTTCPYCLKQTTTRSYGVDCGNAQQIGSGSCGMTITDVFIGIGGGGQ